MGKPRRMENGSRACAMWTASLALLKLVTLTAAVDGGDAAVLLGGGPAWAEELGWRRELPMCRPATSWNASLLAAANWSSAYCFPDPEVTNIM